MVQEKAQIVNDLYEILTSEPQTNRFYWNKSVGFRSELEFSRKCVKENKSILDGGMFIFKKTFPQIACYVTVSKDSKEDYTKFYDQISKSSITKKLFFVQFKGWSENDTEINVKSGTTVTFDRNTLGTPKVNSNNPKDAAKQKKELKKIITPIFDYFEYSTDSNWSQSKLDDIKSFLGSENMSRVGSRKENFLDYLKNYSDDEVESIYCNRFFFDVLLGDIPKGMSDIDKIIFDDGKYVIVEVKNKTPFYAENHPDDLTKSSFGWDTRRLAWFLFLKGDTSLDVLYVVAHINDVKERKILSWKKITIGHWCNCTSWGGDTAGTQMVPYEQFSDF